MLILLNCCLSNSPEKFRTIIFLYTLYIYLVFDLVIPTLIRPLSLKGYIFWTYETYMMYLQMVNTRRNNQGGEDLPPPPPVTMEQLMMMQTQLL